jgi:hypothetical protein
VLRNKLLSYPDLASSSDKYSYSIGAPLRAYFGYGFKGVDAATGVYVFEDLDGNGLINSADLQPAGALTQNYFGGWSNKWSWRSVEVSCLFQFVRQKGQNYLATLPAAPGMLSNQPGLVADRWTRPGSRTDLQKYTATAGTDAAKAFDLYRSSSALVDDASFIRLRNVSLSYRLPAAWLQKARLPAARIYVEGQNLLTFTGYKGADPETQSLFVLPPLRMLAAGIQLNF